LNDTVIVKLSENQFTTTHEEKVKEDGSITLPHIGTVVAANRTAGELQKEIHDRHVPDYYRNLTVVVSSPDQFYYVGGEVRVNNRQPYIGQTTVLKAIQSAGGFTDWANQRRVRVIRSNGETETVNCIKARRDPTQDIPVYPGDQIHVPRRWI
jgi:polysaccharide export outer membrane protein